MKKQITCVTVVHYGILFARKNRAEKIYCHVTNSSKTRLQKVMADMFNDHLRSWRRPHLTILGLFPCGFKAEW